MLECILLRTILPNLHKFVTRIKMSLYRNSLRNSVQNCLLCTYLSSSESAELVSFLHDIWLPFWESGVPPQLVFDVLHGYLDPPSCLLPWGWFGLLLRFIIITAVVSSTLWVLWYLERERERGGGERERERERERESMCVCVCMCTVYMYISGFNSGEANTNLTSRGCNQVWKPNC